MSNGEMEFLKLNKNEIRILKLLAVGLSAKQISGAAGKSESYARNKISYIRRKNEIESVGKLMYILGRNYQLEI